MWIYLKLILTMAIWGGTFIAGRIAVQTMGPLSVAFCRFAIASLTLLVLSYGLDGKLPRLQRRHLPWVALLGLSGVFFYSIFFFGGLQTIEAGRAALIVALNPVVIAIVASLVFREPLTRLKLAGIATSLVGATIIISKGNLTTLLSQGIGRGDLLLLGCVASWVVYTLTGKRVMRELSPLVATTYACLFGTAALLIVALHEGLVQTWMQVAPAAWVGVLYLGMLGTAAGFLWYYEGVQAIGSAKASIFINLVPVFAIAFATVLLGEPITLPLLLGGGLVVTGVYFTNRSS